MHILLPVTALQLPEGETKVHVVGPESNSGPLALKSDALKSDRLRYAARHRVHRQGGKQMTMTHICLQPQRQPSLKLGQFSNLSFSFIQS